MSEQDNVKVVEGLFADFRRGNVAGVLGRLTEDVEWRLGGPTEIVYAGTHRGRDQVAAFFKRLGETADFEEFEPRDYIAQGDRVVVLGHERQRLKATGEVVEVDWAMVFTLKGGKVAAYRNFQDTNAGGATPGGR
jgi:ketosteroid isomerase-like protein